MIERLSMKVNSTELRTTIKKLQSIGPMVFQGSEFGYNMFGGWNLQSRTADYKDGFQVGIERCIRNGKFDYKLAKFLNYSHPFEHVVKTQACLRPYSEILDYLAEQGFYPRRARVTCLKAGGKSIIHRDAPDDQYMCRIHIPIYTNDKCFHWMDYKGKQEKYHMPANGDVFILPVNVMHQITNGSNHDRYHFIVDVYDTKGLTENFKYDGDVNLLIEEAKNYRNIIDRTSLPWYWKIAYAIGRQIVVMKFKAEQKVIQASYKLNDDIKSGKYESKK